MSLPLAAIALAASLAAPTHKPPVDAPIRDGYRPPPTPYAAGNRGIEYDTTPGQAVAVSSSGTVVFAGSVGFHRHVVVRHDDGVRTTYAYLDAVAVRRGQRLGPGAIVGHAGELFHFGARVGKDYVDPHSLFGRATHAVLVDDDLASAVDERSALLDLLRGRNAPRVESGRSVDPRDEWRRDQVGCTPAGVDPPLPTERRIAVLVGGLGSSTGYAAVLDVDTTELGYNPADVHAFSYRPDGTPYGPEDTQQPIGQSARSLARQVEALAAASPGVAIDVFAHSQGGLVARAALGDGALAMADTVVTLGTPHAGSSLAAAGRVLPVRLGPLDPTSASVRDLAAGSPFVLGLPDAPTNGPRVVSIAASTDPVVPAPASRWPGGSNVVLDLAGPPTPKDHSRLTADPATTRELALAIAGLGPTCLDLPVWLTRRAIGGVIAAAHDRVAGTLSVGGGVVGPR